MTLLGLLGRALAVVLLFGVLLLPAADHHLATRLPGAVDLDVHHQLTHHHGAGATADQRPDTAPLLLPLGAAGAGVAVPSPVVADAAGAAPPPFVGRTLPEPAPGIPPSLLEPPLLPPPVLPT